jgi:hypothetical protein
MASLRAPPRCSAPSAKSLVCDASVFASQPCRVQGASAGSPEAQGPGSTRRNFFSSPLPSAAVQGMNAVDVDARHALMQMTEKMMVLLEKEMERLDPHRTGAMPASHLRDAFARARVGVDARVQGARIALFWSSNC